MTSKPSTNNPALLVPGASTQVLVAPDPQQRLPSVDERLVAPESHAEIIDGRVYRTMGSNPPHAVQHAEVAHVFAGVLAPGYSVAVDMLTRLDEESDAAPDVSVFVTPVDDDAPRALEEIAFEVLDTERLGHATTNVEKLARRGVRRIFAIKVASRRVFEWDRATSDWTELPLDSAIVDPCFVVSLPVAALVDRMRAHDAVARALLASGNAVLAQELAAREARGEVRGEARGEARATLETLRSTLLRILQRRGWSVSEAMLAEISACGDRTRIETWIDRALDATSADEVFAS